MNAIFDINGFQEAARLAGQGTGAAAHGREAIYAWLRSLGATEMYPPFQDLMLLPAGLIPGDDEEAIRRFIDDSLSPTVRRHLHTPSVHIHRQSGRTGPVYWVCFNDMLSHREWDERLDHERRLTLGHLIEETDLPKELGPLIARYL
jgi:hypothetical protein